MVKPKKGFTLYEEPINDKGAYAKQGLLAYAPLTMEI